MQTRTRTLAFLTACAATTVLLAAPMNADAALHSRYFKMPSRNIHCALFSGVLRCDILSGMKPEPRGHCDVDWTGMVISKNGKASPVCAGDTVKKKGSPILDYGTRWSRSKIHCKSKMTGLRCHNENGHGFFLSRDKWRKW